MALLNLRRPDATVVRPRTSYRDDLVTVALSLWLLVGLMLDAWAHNNVVELETFFTPWHAVFYSGFAATAAWISWLVWRNRDTHGITPAAVPVGYGLGVLGLPMFALAGAGDLAWHTIFGVEQSLRILFSPTHLGLVTAMVLIVTSPLRSAWTDAGLPARPTLRRLLPAVLAVAFATTMIMLLLQYANALGWSPFAIVSALSDPLDGSVETRFSPVELASAVAVTNVVLLAPLLLLARRWEPPAGSATVLYATLAALAAAITNLRGPAVIVGALLSGVLVDVLLARLRPSATRRAGLLAFAGLAPVVFWYIYMFAASLASGGLPRVTEYWTGMPIAAGLLGLLLALVCVPVQASKSNV